MGDQMNVILLTKNNCPQCQKLKMFLEFALNNKYQNDIKVINKEQDEEAYAKLVEKHQLTTVPVLIHEDEVLSKVEPSLVVNFLEKHIK